ncbi:MAG: selenide, water dikinase SelD [Gammaproteobacteria bacterium]|nr:selenide, water dikinase SelD [Gammaproteobacteria bacterium]
MDTQVGNEAIRLTRLSHGGGCGCKISPAALTDILARLPRDYVDPALLVGTETSDDAAVYRINATQAIVATTDFFMPIVDDPYDFGRIAATNALSDIYAMGARPLFALAIVGMPLDKLPGDVIGRILSGGAAMCREAGITVAGGHSIDAVEPIYGLAVLGEIHPDRIKRNDTARGGDAIILGKPLGVGILSAALKKGILSADAYRQLISTTTQLNRIGSELAGFDTVHAMTDVTGFGLLGHLAELCRGARRGARIAFDALPVIPAAVPLAQQGCTTGAAARNWSGCRDMVRLQTDLAPWQQTLLCDPQTSGGLLVTCAPDTAPEVLSLFRKNGLAAASVIGSILPGEVAIHVDRMAGAAMDTR